MSALPARLLTFGAGVLAGTLVFSALSMPASAADPVDGAQTSGDLLFPNVGNGGYDVSHYDIEIAWNPGAPVPVDTPLNGTIAAKTTIVAATTGPPLRSFSLDLEGLTVTSVKVNNVDATWSRIE